MLTIKTRPIEIKEYSCLTPNEQPKNKEDQLIDKFDNISPL